TPLENIFKIPATLKPKDSSLTITATPKERIVQVQKKEDPFKNFTEVKPPSDLLLAEGQYYAQDSFSGKFAILNHEIPRPKIPSVAAAIVSSAAKTVSQPFGALTKEEWDSEENTVNQLRLEAKSLLLKHGAGHKWYKQKKKDLDFPLRMRDKREDE
ncbi:MAG: hypothetical protein GY861_27930, partial [bacterium]|nr:hypothetical protein [bacterium]